MNGSRSRKIRKSVFGNLPFHGYHHAAHTIIEHVKRFFGLNKEGKEVPMKKVSGQLVCTGKRAEYQKRKSIWKTCLRQGRVTA